MKFKSLIVALVLGLSITINAWAAWTLMRVDEIVFPSSGNEAISIFNGNSLDASIVVNGKIPGQRTAIDFWPVNGLLPEQHAITETVWYRTRFQDWPTFERFSLSALAATPIYNVPAQYRFSVEQGGAGLHRPILFCFDGLVAVGQPAYCPLRIDPLLGVLACDQNDVCTKIGG